jgi:hypothetical protein
MVHEAFGGGVGSLFGGRQGLVECRMLSGHVSGATSPRLCCPPLVNIRAVP